MKFVSDSPFWNCEFFYFQKLLQFETILNSILVVNQSNFESKKIHSSKTVHLRQILLAEARSNKRLLYSKSVVWFWFQARGNKSITKFWIGSFLKLLACYFGKWISFGDDQMYSKGILIMKVRKGLGVWVRKDYIMNIFLKLSLIT